MVETKADRAFRIKTGSTFVQALNNRDLIGRNGVIVKTKSDNDCKMTKKNTQNNKKVSSNKTYSVDFIDFISQIVEIEICITFIHLFC